MHQFIIFIITTFIILHSSYTAASRLTFSTNLSHHRLFIPDPLDWVRGFCDSVSSFLCLEVFLFTNKFAVHEFLSECDYITFGYLLSQIHLSICNVCAPYSGDWSFWQYGKLWSMGILVHWPSRLELTARTSTTNYFKQPF